MREVGFYKSTIGWMKIETEENYVIQLDFVDEVNCNYKNEGYVKIVTEQLDQYFKGERFDFDLNLKIDGTTFQENAWKALMSIEYGTTVSYKEQAIRINNEKAVRAIGNANRKNKIAIIIPCHRVIGSNNKLTGYAGGLEKKEWLINHEYKYKKIKEGK